jgi:hypothetical protein
VVRAGPGRPLSRCRLRREARTSELLHAESGVRHDRSADPRLLSRGWNARRRDRAPHAAPRPGSGHCRRRPLRGERADCSWAAQTQQGSPGSGGVTGERQVNGPHGRPERACHHRRYDDTRPVGSRGWSTPWRQDAGLWSTGIPRLPGSPRIIQYRAPCGSGRG